MKCMHCGANLPEDQLICPRCGREIQIVPDYNPLDDMLTAQLKGGITQTMSLHLEEQERQTGYTGAENTGYRGSAGEETRYVGDSGRAYQPGARSTTSDHRRRSETGRNDTRYINDRAVREKNAQEQARRVAEEERRMRRIRAEKRKERARKKRRKMLLTIVGVCALLAVLIYVFYQNSYTGKVKKGYRLLAASEYENALTVFEKAASGSPKKAEAYTGISKVYIAEDDLDQAEAVFTDQITKQSGNAEIYRAAVEFYIDTNQQEKVSPLLNACTSDAVLDTLTEYISGEPKFSLDETETYDEVQALELTGKGKAIYYTTDGSEPTTSSTKYTGPIKIGEGETVVKAISVNKKGIPSLTESKTYKVEFPIADAPAVTPSTGQYTSEQWISVDVPDKYTAYYTTDGSDPDPENNSATQEYTEPIKMPSGSTIFSFVLQDQKGRLSDITRRNYELNTD